MLWNPRFSDSEPSNAYPELDRGGLFWRPALGRLGVTAITFIRESDCLRACEFLNREYPIDESGVTGLKDIWGEVYDQIQRELFWG